jgi:hypothetical protein
MPRLHAPFASFALLLAASGANAQAPRETAEAKLGAAKIKIEYGSPGWSEERRAQIDRLPAGAAWRLGADTRTTLVVEGGPVLIGDTLIETGGYGLNLRRAGEKEWEFVVYDGSEANVQMEDPEWVAPAAFAEQDDAVAQSLLVALVDAGGRRQIEVRWGPYAASAAVAPVTTTESGLELGGEQASARWFARAATHPLQPGAWTRVGAVGSFFVGDVDCAMEVDLKVEAAYSVVRFTNRERAKVAGRLARLERELSWVEKRAAAGGPIASRLAARRKALEDAKASLSAELAELAANPQPLEVTVPLAAAKQPRGRIGASLLRRGGRLLVQVETGDRAGEAAVDESKLLPSSARD